MLYQLTTSVSAFVLCLVLSRLAVKYSPRWGLVDNPSSRKVHQEGVPIGGFAVSGSIILTGVTFGSFPLPLLVGAGLIFSLGLIDDLWGLAPWTKLVGQFVATIPLIAMGSLSQVTWPPLSTVPFGSLLTTIFLMLWVVGITNAVNLVDGLDGLATGISLIVLAGLSVLVIAANAVPLTSAGVLIGGLVGFLYFNFYPADLFLGDEGSYFLGYILAYYTIYSLPVPGEWAPNAWSLTWALLSVGLPVIDTSWAILRRIYGQRSIMQSDQGHLHHTMLARLGHGKAVIILYGIQILFTGGGVLYWLYVIA